MAVLRMRRVDWASFNQMRFPVHMCFSRVANQTPCMVDIPSCHTPSQYLTSLLVRALVCPTLTPFGFFADLRVPSMSDLEDLISIAGASPEEAVVSCQEDLLQLIEAGDPGDTPRS